MTWSADKILLAGSRRAVEIVGRSSLAPYAFHITDLDGYPWHRPEAAHGLPEGGLLAIRLPDGASAGAGEWREEGEQARHLLSVTATAVLAEHLPADKQIPEQRRLSTAHLALQVGQPILHYRCEMWAGELEFECTLVYSPAESVLCADVSESSSPAAPDALRDGLLRIGLQLPTRYFAPHARDFPWSRYRLQPTL